MKLCRGDIVRMNDELKRVLLVNCVPGRHRDPNGRFVSEGLCPFCSSAHIREFGDCVGVVQGTASPDTDQYVDVRWLPSKLQYAYDIAHLKKVP